MDVVELSSEEVRRIAEVFTQAGRDGRTVRVAVDGGFKLSVGQSMWSPPIGQSKERS